MKGLARGKVGQTDKKGRGRVKMCGSQKLRVGEVLGKQHDIYLGLGVALPASL